MTPVSLRDSAEIFERLREVEEQAARLDERMKAVETAVREVQAMLRRLAPQVTGLVALSSLGLQVLFHFWK